MFCSDSIDIIERNKLFQRLYVLRLFCILAFLWFFI